MRTFGLLLGPPLLAAALALVAVPFRPAVAWVNAVLSLVSLGAAFALGYQVVGGEALVAGWQDILRADALSALLAVCVTIVTALAAWLGPGLEGGDEPRRARRYQIFVNLFAFTMLCAVTTNNVGLMWVAIEATTIASAMLIALDVSKASVEASWKYVLLGSVGIALAFAGTVLAYFDFVRLADSARGGPELDRAPGRRARRSAPRSCSSPSCSSSSATERRRGWRRCTPGCPTPTPRRPRRSRP